MSTWPFLARQKERAGSEYHGTGSQGTQMAVCVRARGPVISGRYSMNVVSQELVKYASLRNEKHSKICLLRHKSCLDEQEMCNNKELEES